MKHYLHMVSWGSCLWSWSNEGPHTDQHCDLVYHTLSLTR